jgi:hypothetical protein
MVEAANSLGGCHVSSLAQEGPVWDPKEPKLAVLFSKHCRLRVGEPDVMGQLM